ncbi:MAG TPA: cyclase family protein [Candidatus Scybalocola faecavium]|nr:cyclase family protein [Candidatus Scybalocola faecavium]
MIDITYPLDEHLLIYPGDPVYKAEWFLSMDKGDSCNVTNLTLGCHTGTHVDAPLHFLQGGKSLDEMDLDRLNGPVRVIEYFPETPGDISEAFLKKCHIQPGERVIFKTQNSCRFAGKNLLEDYVAFDLSGARYLAQLGVACLGIDYLTIEPKGSDGSVHREILGAGIPVVETLDLRKVSGGGYEMVCLPLRLSGREASPVRALLKPLDMAPGAAHKDKV